jgi:hypothetical protein
VALSVVPGPRIGAEVFIAGTRYSKRAAISSLPATAQLMIASFETKGRPWQRSLQRALRSANRARPAGVPGHPNQTLRTPVHPWRQKD